jgi:hypothetical protein
MCYLLDKCYAFRQGRDYAIRNTQRAGQQAPAMCILLVALTKSPSDVCDDFVTAQRVEQLSLRDEPDAPNGFLRW